jgi:hypothetical protein
MTTVPVYVRHPLGLPEGSVRSLLALMVCGTIWAMLLAPEQNPQPIPLYLYYLMFLILGHYFAVRGHAPHVSGPRNWAPLFLPRGTIRLVLFLGFVAVIAWGFYNDPSFLERLTPNVSKQPLLLVVVVGAFLLGVLVSRLGRHLMARPEGLPPWFQDIQAWLALLAVLLLSADVIYRFVVYPSLAPENRREVPNWEGVLAAVVAFYFGARS